MPTRKWIRMRVGSKSALLKLLDSKLAMTLDFIINEAHEDGTWISSTESRAYLQMRVGASPPTLFRYIKQLHKKGILLKERGTGRGVYKLNKELIKLGAS